MLYTNTYFLYTYMEMEMEGFRLRDHLRAGSESRPSLLVVGVDEVLISRNWDISRVTAMHWEHGTKNKCFRKSCHRTVAIRRPTHGYKRCIHGSGGPPGSFFSNTKYSHQLRRAYSACAKT